MSSSNTLYSYLNENTALTMRKDKIMESATMSMELKGIMLKESARKTGIDTA